MGKVTFEDEAPPDHPIYTEAVLTIGPRLTRPVKSSVTESIGEEVEAGETSNASADGKQTLLELALSKGFKLADLNDPIYEEGVTLAMKIAEREQE